MVLCDFFLYFVTLFPCFTSNYNFFFLFRFTEKLIIIQSVKWLIDSWMDWIMVWNPFNLRCSLSIGSFSQSDPKHGFCVEEWLYLIWALHVSTRPPAPDITAYPSIVSYKLSCQSIRNVCHHKDFPDLLDPPISQLTHTGTQTPAGVAEPFSLWMGAWKDAAAEEEHRHGNSDVEDHICELPNTFTHRVLSMLGQDPPATPICSLGRAPRFILIHVFKEKKRPKTHFKSKICKLIILLSWWLL